MGAPGPCRRERWRPRAAGELGCPSASVWAGHGRIPLFGLPAHSAAVARSRRRCSRTVSMVPVTPTARTASPIPSTADSPNARPPSGTMAPANAISQTWIRFLGCRGPLRRGVPRRRSDFRIDYIPAVARQSDSDPPGSAIALRYQSIFSSRCRCCACSRAIRSCTWRSCSVSSPRRSAIVALPSHSRSSRSNRRCPLGVRSIPSSRPIRA